jgi:hypothetical protein
MASKHFVAYVGKATKKKTDFIVYQVENNNLELVGIVSWNPSETIQTEQNTVIDFLSRNRKIEGRYDDYQLNFLLRI